MGPPREPIFRRGPQRTLLPGLGIASAVLAGVLVAVTLAAGLITFDDDRTQIGTRPSTVQPVADPVQVRALATARVRARVAPPRAARPAPVAETKTPRRNTVIAVGTPESFDKPPPPPLPPPPPPPPPPPAPAPPNPLQPVADGLNDATDDLAGTVRKLTDDLGDAVAPLSPELGQVLSTTGDAVGDILQGTGNLLGQTLGNRAGR